VFEFNFPNQTLFLWLNARLFKHVCSCVFQPWQWQCGAVAVFLSWMGLLLFIQNIPRFGIYVLMFSDVLQTFMSFFVVFLLFIVGFGTGFYCLLQNQVRPIAFDQAGNASVVLKSTLLSKTNLTSFRLAGCTSLVGPFYVALFGFENAYRNFISQSFCLSSYVARHSGKILRSVNFSILFLKRRTAHSEGDLKFL